MICFVLLSYRVRQTCCAAHCAYMNGKISMLSPIVQNIINLSAISREQGDEEIS